MAHLKQKKKAAPPAHEAAARGARRHGAIVAGVCVLLVLACIAVYGQTLSHDFLAYDDSLYITQNPDVARGLSWSGVVWSFTTNRAMYLHPLTWMSHMLDCTLYGLRPWGHHLTNLLLQSASSVLLFLVLAAMTRRLWPSALVAALFAVHPLNVESVAWIAERRGVLSTLFWTATLGAYAWHRQRPGKARYMAVAFLFLLALLSKPMVVTLPFVLLLLDYWPLNRMDSTASLAVMARKTAPLAVEKIPLFLLSALISATTYLMQLTGGNLNFGEKTPFTARCADAAVVYVIYLIKAFCPSGLAAYYPQPAARPLWQVAGAAVLLLAVTVFCLRHFRRHPYLIVGWLWYLGTLVPVIKVVQAGPFSHADRYTYIPLIGIFIMLAWGAIDLAAAWRVPKPALAAFWGVVLALLTLCARVQAGYWHDGDTLFRHAIDVGQESSAAYNTLGESALHSGRFEEARAYLGKALEIKPDHLTTLGNLGMVAMNQGRTEEARKWLTKALEVNPRSVIVLVNLSTLAMNDKRPDEARALLESALEVDPGNVGALTNMGVLALNGNRFDEAAVWLKKALDLDPVNVTALANMGVRAQSMGRMEEAKSYFDRANALNPAGNYGKH